MQDVTATKTINEQDIPSYVDNNGYLYVLSHFSATITPSCNLDDCGSNSIIIHSNDFTQLTVTKKPV